MTTKGIRRSCVAATVVAAIASAALALASAVPPAESVRAVTATSPERLTPDWGGPDAWGLVASCADADATTVAVVRGTDYVTVPSTGWRTRDLFVRGVDGELHAVYGP